MHLLLGSSCPGELVQASITSVNLPANGIASQDAQPRNPLPAHLVTPVAALIRCDAARLMGDVTCPHNALNHKCCIATLSLLLSRFAQSNVHV